MTHPVEPYEIEAAGNGPDRLDDYRAINWIVIAVLLGVCVAIGIVIGVMW